VGRRGSLRLTSTRRTAAASVESVTSRAASSVLYRMSFESLSNDSDDQGLTLTSSHQSSPFPALLEQQLGECLGKGGYVELHVYYNITTVQVELRDS